MRLVFTRAPGSWLSWLIRLVTGGRASHVGVQVNDLVTSAEEEGVVRRSRAVFLVGRRVVEEWSGPDSVLVGLDSFLGDGYDYSGDLGVALGLDLGTRGREFCSELVVRAVRCPEFAHLDPETTSPHDILRAVRRGRTFARVAS